jgi:hypothetical protein
MQRAALWVTILLAFPLGAQQAGDGDRYRRVLRELYPTYRVAEPWASNLRELRESPDQFVDDILFGDFNADGHEDFAAILVRERSFEEAALDPDRYRRSDLLVYLVVACNGIDSKPAAAGFRCEPIFGPKSGAFGRELDFVAAGRWLDAFDDEKCVNEIRARAETKVLALVQAFGHCDVLYFPQPEGAYAQCGYCAD